MMVNFRVCVASRNAKDYTHECISSLVTQDYPRGKLIIDWTDDASDCGPDDFYEAVRVAENLLGTSLRLTDTEKDPEDESPHWVTQNCERIGGLANLWRAIQRADDDDVCVLMGGDDYLRPGALALLAKAYDEDPECWATYGEFENSDGRVTNHWEEWDGILSRPPKHFMWCPLTCRAWLAKKVLEEDLKLAGSFFMSSGDGALNTPIVEMAGPKHLRWIREKWYVRRIHEQNDGYVDSGYQTFCAMRAYQKPRYSRIKDRSDVPTRDPKHVLPYGLIYLPHEMHPRIMDCAELAADVEKNGPDGSFNSLDVIERKKNAKRLRDDLERKEPSGKHHCYDQEKDCNESCDSTGRCGCCCDRCDEWNEYLDLLEENGYCYVYGEGLQQNV